MTSNSLAIYTPEKQREVASLLGLEGSTNHLHLLFQLAEHYNLDPLLKEIVLIPKKGPFIGVWGRLHIAHSSGVLDGLEMDDEWETEKHYCVRVIVWRKDMSHPAAKVIGRVGKHEGSNDKQTGEWTPKEWPLEIARARGLRGGLGFAFSIHDIFDDTGDDWSPPPDERLQATVIDVDVPDAADTRKEDPPQKPAAKPKKQATKAARGSAANRGQGDGPASTVGHRGAAAEPPPGSPAARPQNPPGGTQASQDADAASTVVGAQAAPPGDTIEQPTLIVGGHSTAQIVVIKAKAAGIEEDALRNELIGYLTGGKATRATEVTETQKQRVFDGFDGLATGALTLSFYPNGAPYLSRRARP